VPVNGLLLLTLSLRSRRPQENPSSLGVTREILTKHDLLDLNAKSLGATAVESEVGFGCGCGTTRLRILGGISDQQFVSCLISASIRSNHFSRLSGHTSTKAEAVEPRAIETRPVRVYSQASDTRR